MKTIVDSIYDLIWRVRKDTFSDPTTLYIGRDDYCQLRGEIHSWEIFPRNTEHEEFMGMEVIQVDRRHHLRVV